MSDSPSMPYELPAEVAAVLDRFRVAEFSSQAKDGTPLTVPLCPWLGDDGTITVTTSIAIPSKLFNVRRNPRVSLYYSEPTGSGLEEPPFVLVQGDAAAPDHVYRVPEEGRHLFLRISRRQPDSPMDSWLMRRLASWYWWRVNIVVTPRRIRWWPKGDLSQPAREIEIAEVPCAG